MPNRLKGYRVMAGYTQKDMASLLGISSGAYTLKEKGKTKITLEESKKIYEKLKSRLSNITYEDIFLD